MLLRMKARVAALAAIGALVMLAAVVSRGTSAVPLGQGRPLFGPLPLPTIDLSIPPGSDDPVTDPGSSEWLRIVGWLVVLIPLFILVAAIAAAIVISILEWRRRRRLFGSSPVLADDDQIYPDAPAARLLHAARQAQLALTQHQGGSPSDAVVAAWLRLEAAAADSGMRRQAHQTPTEFTDILGAREATVRPALDDLRRLYQRARFATTPTADPTDIAAARTALAQIVHNLSAESATT